MLPFGFALLQHARSLVWRGWTQRADARAADGTIVEPWREQARAWSLLGALVAALEHLSTEGEALAISELALACASLAETLNVDTLEGWNDRPERTKTQVIAALDDAIQRCQDTPWSPN